MIDLMISDCKIHLKQRQYISNLIFRGSFFAIGVIGLIINSDNYFLTYGYTAIGLLNLVSYFLSKRKGYLSVVNGILKTHHNPFFNKQIVLNKVNNITKTKDGIILSSTNEKLKINTALISETSLQTFNTIIDFLEEEIKNQRLPQ